MTNPIKYRNLPKRCASSHGTNERLAKDSLGFTLVEVMIALFIFSICAMTVSKQLQQTVDVQLHLEKVTLGTVYLQSRLQEIRAFPGKVSNSRAQQALETPFGKWTIEESTHTTTHEKFKRIEVVIKDEDHNAITHLNSYVALP